MLPTIEVMLLTIPPRELVIELVIVLDIELMDFDSPLNELFIVAVIELIPLLRVAPRPERLAATCEVIPLTIVLIDPDRLFNTPVTVSGKLLINEYMPLKVLIALLTRPLVTLTIPLTMLFTPCPIDVIALDMYDPTVCTIQLAIWPSGSAIPPASKSIWTFAKSSKSMLSLISLKFKDIPKSFMPITEP
jgi:hypothetical protein